MHRKRFFSEPDDSPSKAILVSIEKFNRATNIVLVDFTESNEFDSFDILLGLNYPWQQRPTMIRIINYYQRNLIEGSVCQISNENLILIRDRIELVEDSLLIGFQIDLAGFPVTFLEKAKPRKDQDWNLRSLTSGVEIDNVNFDITHSPIDKLIVRNIGQGSWNELISDSKCFLIFDCGTIHTTSRIDLISMFGNKNHEYQASKPGLILSHWDVDHYHFLLAFEDDTIKSIPMFMHRDIIPNLTAKKTIGRFNILNTQALLPVRACSSRPKRSSTALKSVTLNRSGSLLLFNACNNRSRNKSGIGLCLRKKKINVILPGDFDYSQVSSYMLPAVNYNSDHYLIVPHHGGNAGKFVYTSSQLNSLKQAVISVGNNPYKPKHPHIKNITDLQAKGFSVVRTDLITGDHIIYL